MNPADVPTVRDILAEFDVDGLLDDARLELLIDTLNNRELILRSDAVDRAENRLIATVAESLFPTKS